MAKFILLGIVMQDYAKNKLCVTGLRHKIERSRNKIHSLRLTLAIKKDRLNLQINYSKSTI